VRPPNNRSRASTLGASGGHSRGHSRNLSTSSIASTASTISTFSQMSTQDEFRHRPLHLSMASTPSADTAGRTRLTLDTFNPQLMSGSPGPTLYSQQDSRSHSGYTTPPSATTYSSATGSPRFSSMQSPISAAGQARQPFGAQPHSHTRRLSVPSSAGVNPFQPHQGPAGYPQQAFLTPLPSASGSSHTSAYASPTTGAFPGSHARRESTGDADWRRRTWHPSTYTGMRPATSGLSYYQTPDSPKPAQVPPQQQQGLRLPGIESFDHAPPVPALPRRVGSPMQIDSPQHASGEIQSGIKRLEIAGPEPRTEHPRQQSGQLQGQQLPSLRETAPMPAAPPQPAPGGFVGSHARLPSREQMQLAPQPQPAPPPPTFRHSDQPTTPRRNKRHGWINGPLPNTQVPSQHPNQPVFSQYVNYSSVQNPPVAGSVQAPTHHPANVAVRTSPEDSGSSDGIPTPASSNMSEWNPAAMFRHEHAVQPAVADEDRHRQGAPQHVQHRPDISSWSLQSAQMESRKREREEEMGHVAGPRDSGVDVGQQHEMQLGSRGDMRRLEALVAVATGEQRA
jgi:C2H2 transcription facotor